MSAQKSLLATLVIFARLMVSVSSAEQPELKTLHGTMIMMLSENEGFASEIWAKGNNTRSEMDAGDITIISIQRGATLYTFIEGDLKGTKQILKGGLGTLGLIRQIEKVKAHGNRQGSEVVDGDECDIYHYDVNAPAAMSIFYLSKVSSLPRFAISVVQTGEKKAEAMRMIYRDMEANVEISDTLFELPASIVFTEATSDRSSTLKNSKFNENARQRVEETEERNDSNLVVVISKSAEVLDGNKQVVGNRHIGDVLRISRRKDKWMHFEDSEINGWIKTRDVIDFEKANDFFMAGIKEKPQDASLFLGKGKLLLWTSQSISSLPEYDKKMSDALLDTAFIDFTQSSLLKPDAQAFIGKGVIRTLKGNYEAAIREYDRALVLEPENIEAIRRRAVAKINIDEIDQAIKDCNIVLSLQQRNPEVLSLRCYALGLKGDLDKAMMSCDTAIEIDPNLATSYMHRGQIWSAKGDDLKAKSDYDEAIRLGDDAARVARSRILYEQGKYQEAIDDLNVVIELEPKNPRFYFQRGTIFMNLSEVDRAIKDLTKSIEIEANAAAYSNRGAAWIEKQEFTKAMEDFNSAIELDPDRARNYENRAQLHAQLQQYQEAIADLTKYLQLVPDDLAAHVHRGLARYFSAEFDAAIEDFNYAINIIPNDPELYVFRGSAWNAKEESQRAIDDFGRAIELNPDSAEAYTYRGVAWHRLNQNTKALSDLEEALQLDPSFEIGYINRGSFWSATAHYEKALADYHVANRLNPDRAATLNEIASILASAPDETIRSGNEAVKYATRACELTEWANYEYLSTLAAAHAESGDYKSAIDWQMKSIELTPEDTREEGLEKLQLFKSDQSYRIDKID